MLKQISITCLTGVMAISLAACGAANVNKDMKDSKQENTTIKMFANFNPADPTAGDKAFIEACEKATGFKIEFTVPPSTSYPERLQIMLASGDYPDAVQFLSTDDQAYLNAVQQSILVPVNQYIKNAPNIMKYTYDISWDALKTKNDDDIYGIPRSSMARYDGFMVRKDWLEKVGLELPADHAVTLEEFTEILRRFTENDPDGNGKKDTFGLLASADVKKRFNPVMTAPFECYGWQKYDGEEYPYMNVSYSKTKDNYKRAMEYTADIFKKGYIELNAAMNTVTDINDKFSKGTVAGVVPGFSGQLIAYETDLKKNVPSGKLDYLYVKNSNGEVKGGAFGTGCYGQWGITSGAKKPEAVVKVLDWMLGDAGWDIIINGTEGVEYTMQNGKRVADQNQKGAWKNLFMRRKGDFDFFTSAVNLETADKERIRPIVDMSINKVIFSQDRGYVPPTAKSIGYINYQKTMDETVTKICLGYEPSSGYDKALDGWYKNGGQQYVQEMNDYIKRINKDQ